MSTINIPAVREKSEQLLSEIRQIHEQYKLEVPKKRRPWPKSIQERILELWRLGMSSHQIALETGLPAQRLRRNFPNVTTGRFNNQEPCLRPTYKLLRKRGE